MIGLEGVLLPDARRYLEDAVGQGRIPGAQVHVSRRGQVVWHEALGAARVDPVPHPLSLATRFDVASLTKALSTATLAALLVGEGQLGLDERLSDFYPATKGTARGRITVRHLLAHASGLPAYRPYYLELGEADAATARTAIVHRILAEPLASSPGARQCYSDLDFILLGEMLVHRLGIPLEKAFDQRIAHPLALGAGFRRVEGGGQDAADSSEFAATEHCPWRKQTLCGAVHDDHAWLMGGAAGHAGLFATAAEVNAVTAQWLAAWHGRDSLLAPDVVRRFWERFDREDPAQTWALGWDTPSPAGSTAGTLFSTPSVGHLGFTGTSVWVDIPREIIVVLLTNRIHPTRDNLVMKTFRPAFHEQVMRALIDS